ncbi:PqqA peptide cyclase [subsurface metagenome]
MGVKSDDMRISILKPFGKFIARRLVVKCKKCEKEKLLSAFDYYAGNSDGQCISCRLTSHLMKPLIHRFFTEMSVSERVTRQLVSDPRMAKSMLNAVKGVAKFGIKKPQPAGVPVVIVWNFTNQCNLNCLHCHQDSCPTPNQAELDTSQALKVVDNMADAGISTLTFSGGEPLMRPDLYEVAKYASDRGIFCSIATNGTLITSGVPEKLSRAGIKSVEVGLDGVSAKTHDFLRNTPGSFDAAVEGIKNCVEFGKFCDVTIATTLNKMNVKEIPQIIDLCEDLGATKFYLNRIIAAGRGKNATHLDVSPKEKMEVLNHLYDRFIRAVHGDGIICYTRGMTYFARLCYQRSNGNFFPVSEVLSGCDRIFDEDWRNETPKIIKNLAEGFGGCSAGLTYAGLSAEGDLLPCVPASTKLGNLLEEKLEDIWTNNEILNRIRDRQSLKGACGRCTYNGICGGCRYTGYEAVGDWLGTDTSCPYGAKSS